MLVTSVDALHVALKYSPAVRLTIRWLWRSLYHASLYLAVVFFFKGNSIASHGRTFDFNNGAQMAKPYLLIRFSARIEHFRDSLFDIGCCVI